MKELSSYVMIDPMINNFAVGSIFTPLDGVDFGDKVDKLEFA